MDLMSTVSTDSVNYYPVCLNRVHAKSKCLLIADILTDSSVRGMQIFVEIVCAKEETSVIWGPQNQSGTQERIIVGSCRSQNRTTSNILPRWLKSPKGCMFWPTLLKPSLSAPPNRSRWKIAGKIRREGSGKASSKTFASLPSYQPCPFRFTVK